VIKVGLVVVDAVGDRMELRGLVMDVSRFVGVVSFGWGRSSYVQVALFGCDVEMLMQRLGIW